MLFSQCLPAMASHQMVHSYLLQFLFLVLEIMVAPHILQTGKTLLIIHYKMKLREQEIVQMEHLYIEFKKSDKSYGVESNEKLKICVAK